MLLRELEDILLLLENEGFPLLDVTLVADEVLEVVVGQDVLGAVDVVHFQEVQQTLLLLQQQVVVVLVDFLLGGLLDGGHVTPDHGVVGQGGHVGLTHVQLTVHVLVGSELVLRDHIQLVVQVFVVVDVFGQVLYHCLLVLDAVSVALHAVPNEAVEFNDFALFIVNVAFFLVDHLAEALKKVVELSSVVIDALLVAPLDEEYLVDPDCPLLTGLELGLHFVYLLFQVDDPVPDLLRLGLLGPLHHVVLSVDLGEQLLLLLVGIDNVVMLVDDSA